MVQAGGARLWMKDSWGRWAERALLCPGPGETHQCPGRASNRKCLKHVGQWLILLCVHLGDSERPADSECFNCPKQTSAGPNRRVPLANDRLSPVIPACPALRELIRPLLPTTRPVLPRDSPMNATFFSELSFFKTRFSFLSFFFKV